MKIIFGLGNPGIRYKKNRHNIGYVIVEALAAQKKALFKKSIKLNAWQAEIKIGTEKVVLIKPDTFMNNSGVSVSKALRKYGILPQESLVVYDDIDLGLGSLRFREKGSSGGHRGVASILELISSPEINRLRVGINNSFNLGELADYVLSNFRPDENVILEKVIPIAVSACSDWVKRGGDYVMKNYNQRKL